MINGVTPVRSCFFSPFFTSTFLQRDFKCTGSFLQRDGHFPQEKQYFLSFVGFSCPRKASEIVSRNCLLFRSQSPARLKIPLCKTSFFGFFRSHFLQRKLMVFTTGSSKSPVVQTPARKNGHQKNAHFSYIFSFFVLDPPCK